MHEVVPWSDREYEKETQTWYFNLCWLDEVLALVERYYPEVEVKES